MKDIIKFSDLKRLHPYSAVGKVCVDLLDPITGKVKKRVDGKNMVFPDSLYSGTEGSWVGDVSTAYLVLNDNDTPINANMPYILGNTLGYGQAGQAGSGLYRGAYNAANQVIAQKSYESVRWKFQYDFTAAQAIGTIKNIGLTHQYGGKKKLTPDRFAPAALLASVHTYTADGRYSYTCSDAGVITKYDNYLGTSATIDVSAIVGSVSGDKKTVGYAPATGLYYIYVYSATAANRKMHVFTDNTFSTLSTTYSISNITYSETGKPMYIYGNKAFWINGANIYKGDFVNNILQVSQSLNFAHTIMSGGVENLHYNSLGHDKYIFILGASYAYYDMSTKGVIYDMATETTVSCMSYNPRNAEYRHIPSIRHPLTTNFMPVVADTTLYNNCAIAAKVLDEPVTKPDNLGMRATYELEVFWDL